MSDDREDAGPPVSKYELTLVIRGNSHEEIEGELLAMTRGGYLLDSDYYKRDEFRAIGGRRTATLAHTNPEMTPERYKFALHQWAENRRSIRATAPEGGLARGGNGTGTGEPRD